MGGRYSAGTVLAVETRKGYARKVLLRCFTI